MHRRAGWRAAVLACAAALAAGPAAPAQSPPCDRAPGDPDCASAPVGCGKGAANLRWRGRLDESPEVLEQLAEAAGDTDLISNDLQIEVVPGGGTISGFNLMTLDAVTNGLTQFTFMLRSQYVISSIVLNEGTPGAVTIPGASVVSVGTYGRRITLDRAYNAGQRFTVKVNYAGNVVTVNGAFTFTTLNGQTLVYTLSEPYYAATWWPCKDGEWNTPGDNADKATLKLAVTVPSGLKVTASGMLDGVDALSGARSRYRFHSNYPMSTYLVAFAAHPYNTYAGTYTYPGGSMPFEMNISPGSDTAGNRAAWDASRQMMETFRPIFGLYPFTGEKYGVYQFGFGGGMEHQTNSGMGGFGETLIAHELAHQWWGDWVTCRQWNDIWINEGMATYSEALWLERKPGSTGLPALSGAMQNRRPGSLNGTVYPGTTDFATLFSNDFTYRKASWVFHMLRGVLGDEDFFAFLGALRATYGGSAVTSAQLQTVAETVYGGSLNWFFLPWLYQVGGPTYTSASRNISVGGQAYVELYLTQTQNGNWPTFTMPVNVALTGITPSARTVWNDARTQWYLFPVSGTASGVVIDPDGWILTGNKSSTAFVSGPPKIISVTPAPGATLQAGSMPPIAVRFHQGVTAPASAFTLVGATSGPRSVNVSYNPATFTATITPTAPLPGGAYTLTVQPTVVSGSTPLDGEIASPTGPGGLPSGNGQPGGAGVIVFPGVSPACGLADVTSIGGPPAPPDGQLTVDDVIAFVNAFSDGTDCPGQSLVACNLADVCGLGGPPAPPDGQLTVDDIIAFFNAFGDGCA